MDENIVLPAGFRAAGVAAGIKKRGGLDVALLVSDAPCVAAGVFTRNQIKAAPVRWDQAALAHNAHAMRAVVINSGCANAVTGAQGEADTADTALAVAEACDVAPTAVLVMSTGVIGQPLPMPKLHTGITAAVAALQGGAEGWNAAAHAIMTTDTRPKLATKHCMIGATAIMISGICKGAGMIHPDMATMLALVCTDAAVSVEALQAALGWATDRSFNAVTIDGDSSTNDTVLVLANGVAGNAAIQADTPEFAVFQVALTAVMSDLAQQIARDGEGATKFATIRVTGALAFADAQRIAKTIATSPLVKTALFGADANWGRVLAAAGRAGVMLDPTRLALWFDALQLVAEGAPTDYSEADAHATLTKAEVVITLDLGLGTAEATVWTCDFSHDYVSINADYRT